MLNGARGPRVEEPLGWAQIYPIQWHEPRINLAELAKLRWIEGWSRKALAERYGKSQDAIQNYFQLLKKTSFHGVDLATCEITAIKKILAKEM